jgi:hypothetical protein
LLAGRVTRLGKFSPNWYIGQVFWKLTKEPYFWGYFFHSKIYVLILPKNVLGYNVGDFFTNTSGHHAWRLLICRAVWPDWAKFRRLSAYFAFGRIFSKNRPKFT